MTKYILPKLNLELAIEKELKAQIINMYEVPHPTGFGNNAVVVFESGDELSILCHSTFYSNGIDTFEIAIINDGKFDNTDLNDKSDDVQGWLSVDSVVNMVSKLARKSARLAN